MKENIAQIVSLVTLASTIGQWIVLFKNRKKYTKDKLSNSLEQILKYTIRICSGTFNEDELKVLCTDRNVYVREAKYYLNQIKPNLYKLIDDLDKIVSEDLDRLNNYKTENNKSLQEVQNRITELQKKI